MQLNIPFVNQRDKLPSSLRTTGSFYEQVEENSRPRTLLQSLMRRNVLSYGRGLGFPAVSRCFVFISAPQADMMFITACCTGCLRFVSSLLWISSSALPVYGGLSTFTLVTLPVKHLWNRMSGLVGWLSQSSFLLMKCFLNPCGPLEEVSLVWLDPSLASPPDGENQKECFKTGYVQREGVTAAARRRFPSGHRSTASPGTLRGRPLSRWRGLVETNR